MKQYLRNPKHREHQEDEKSQRGQKAAKNKDDIEESSDEGGD
tara:strand:+ start:106 stop:231 length:126 start_codon:yes stop_codon:yes gene_type:complete